MASLDEYEEWAAEWRAYRFGRYREDVFMLVAWVVATMLAVDVVYLCTGARAWRVVRNLGWYPLGRWLWVEIEAGFNVGKL